MAGELLGCVSREKPGICVSVLLFVLIWGMGSLMEFGGLFQLRIADDDQWSSLRMRFEGSDP